MEEIKKQPDGLVSFDLTVPWNQIQTAYRQLLEQTARYIEIKGFRKGKAPLDLVEKKIDTGKIYGRALEKLLPKIYVDFIQKHKLKPLTDPQITPTKAEPNQDWLFKVKIAERPQIKLGNYQTYLKKSLQTAKTKSKSNSKKTDKNQSPQKEDNKKLKLIFDSLLKNAQVEICDLLIETETKSALSRLVSQLQPLKISLEDYAKSLKKSVKDLVEEYRKTARDNLRLEFILSELIKQENPKISDQELAKFKPKPQETAYLKYQLQKQKVIDKLLKL